jgi:hypothetical protein
VGTRLYRDEFYPPVEHEICQENIDDFFRFVHERHQIWRKRFILKLSQEEWTNNPILKTYKYTNVYRELDRGTLYYLSTIAKEYMDSVDPDKTACYDNEKAFKRMLWKTIIYRLCNRIETLEETGFPEIEDFDSSNLHNSFYEKLDNISKRGLPVMTSAHLTCPAYYGNTKVEAYMNAINDAHQKLNEMVLSIFDSTCSEEVFTILRRVHCVGVFIAYEVLCDLMYTKSIRNRKDGRCFVEDDWANPGPGAIEGIRLTYPSTSNRKNIIGRMVQLKDEQGGHFDRLGIKFDFYQRFTQEHLSLRSLEHSLCEYQKYWLQKHHLGKQRMIFNKDSNRNVNDHKVVVDPDTGDSLIRIHSDGMKEPMNRI